ncbi:hypothetical protein [Streptomyces halobius]|uniref:Transposase n=1 Tax=Streptomyces halobius TaxID=2879846 RepID=A0ABY4LZ05_9ACTN|nr:hypothetical protein [Streptomyces halobius]UQA90740.1 hypothetical protein K9S39_01525 [Streptomyces halobius]
MLRVDLDAPRKQRHTVKRIFDRLVDEHAAQGVTYPMVRAYVADRRPTFAPPKCVRTNAPKAVSYVVGRKLVTPFEHAARQALAPA